jgi:hypothetical protein
MCAKMLGYTITPLLDKDALFYPQENYTHIWGAKQVLRESLELRESFILQCKNRLLKDFPEYSSVVSRIEAIPHC